MTQDYEFQNKYLNVIEMLMERKNTMSSWNVPIPKFEPVPLLNFKAKPIPILNHRYLDF